MQSFELTGTLTRQMLCNHQHVCIKSAKLRMYLYMYLFQYLCICCYICIFMHLLTQVLFTGGGMSQFGAEWVQPF